MKKTNKKNPIKVPNEKALKKEPKLQPQNTIRIPRSLGLTLLIKEYNETKNKDTLHQIQKLTINEWANNNFKLMNRNISIEQLASMLQVEVNKVVQHVASPMKNWLSKYKVEEQYRVLAGFIAQMALADRAQFQAQIELLTAAQGDKYVPFLTEQVNKALSLLDTNTRTIFSIAGAFKVEGPKVNKATQINISSDANPMPLSDHGKYLGVNEAVKLLEAKRDTDLLQDPEAQMAIVAQYSQEPLPEVIATKQQGLTPEGHNGPKRKKEHTDRNEDNGHILTNPIIIP